MANAFSADYGSLTEHPHITRCGETSEVDGLGCHPFDRKPADRGCDMCKRTFTMTSERTLCVALCVPKHLCSTPPPPQSEKGQSHRA